MATDYNAIAAKHIRKPGTKPPRILVYGKNKKGKTHLCASAPDVLILDPEEGTTHYPDLDVWPIEKWTDLNDAYNALAHGIKSPVTGRPYQWVALDGCTRFANMALRYAVSPASKYTEERELNTKPQKFTQQDYGTAGEMFKGMVLNFCTLPQGLIFTAQERMEVSEGLDPRDPKNVPTYYVCDLPRGARAPLNAAVDVIGRIYTQREVESYRVKLKSGEIEDREREVIQRHLWITPHDDYDTGFRSQRSDVPDFLINPTIESLVATLRKDK